MAIKKIDGVAFYEGDYTKEKNKRRNELGLIIALAVGCALTLLFYVLKLI